MSIRSLVSLRSLLIRQNLSQAGPSTYHSKAVRGLSTTLLRSDLSAELEKQLNPREVIERKRKEFEEKYGDKLKKKVERCVSAI